MKVTRFATVSILLIAVAAAGFIAWDYTTKARNRDLCLDLVRFIADLHKADLRNQTDNSAGDLQLHAFRATELVASASRRLEPWQSDSNERRRVVVKQMQLALGNYRRLADLYHLAASGNFSDRDAILAALTVKSDAGADALFDAAGWAALDHVNGPPALSLSASGRRQIRETVELLFATELAQSYNNPQYKAGKDVWAAITLHDALK